MTEKEVIEAFLAACLFGTVGMWLGRTTLGPLSHHAIIWCTTQAVLWGAFYIFARYTS
jgi:hypothetical protein